jgi:citrate synthase
MDRLLTTEEAARRLGVKATTLYAYVSRGLLASHRDPVGRGSLFDLADIEALAARSRGGRQTATRLATITTGVTRLDQELGPLYRGRPATELAATSSFEEVAELLWQSEGEGDWSAPALGACPLTHTLDRMRWAIVLCGATDPLRADLRPVAVARAGRRVAAALTDAVGPPPPGGEAGASVGARLTSRLTASSAGSRAAAGAEAGTRSGGAVSKTIHRSVESFQRDPRRSATHAAAVPTAAVTAALVLMADHELATSTMAVRVAASARADPYDALLAGLATLAGPLHGGASQQAYELLVVAERDGVARALNDILRERGRLPGFGHTVYTHGDPRFDALLALAEPLLSDDRLAIVREVVALAAAHDVPLANCDLALAALSWGTGMPPDAGRTIFAVARVAGWTAHYMEELTERPLRFRARAVYSI